MKRNHPPILWIAALVLLASLAVAGGPIVFVLLVMAGPLIVILAFAVRAVLGSSSSRVVKPK
jgi:hypothetical protein